jgi:hypothetical protein
MKMKKRTTFLSLMMLISAAASSQHVLLEQDVNADTIQETSGPNLKKYTHLYASYGLVLGETEGDSAEIKIGNSSQFAMGVRYKRRLSNFYAIGFDLSYNITTFHMEQDSAKLLPDTLLHDKEKLASNNVTLQLYNRFNFGKRGNHIGNYLDIGGYGEWAFSITHSTKDTDDRAKVLGAKTTKTTNKGLKYTAPFNYGLVARIGIGKLAFFGKYRFSDMFVSKYDYPELPRLVIGLEIGIISN